MKALRNTSWLFVLSVLLSVTVQTFGQTTYTPYTVVTIAGLASHSGTNDGTNSSARFWIPYGAAVDNSGNVYVSDDFKGTIRRLSPQGTNWVVTTIATQLSQPSGIAVDSATNLYVADFGDWTIREISPVGTNWNVSNVAGTSGSYGTNDGTGGMARFGNAGGGPRGIAVDNAGNLYVADTPNSTIRKISPAGTNWNVTTIAGRPGSSGSSNGTNSVAQFYDPTSLVVDSATNLFLTDAGNDTIREITPVGTNWSVTTIAGIASDEADVDGTNSNARFTTPYGLALDLSGSLYVGDSAATLRKLTSVGTNWVVTTLAGLALNYGTNDGTGYLARFDSFGDLTGLAVDNSGNVYVVDQASDVIRKGYHEDVPAVIIASGTNFGFTNSLFGFDLTAPPGQQVIIEASPDLSAWQAIWTNTFGTNGVLSFSDSQAGVFSNRFYRALTP